MLLDAGVIVGGDGARWGAGMVALIAGVVGLPWAVVMGWSLVKSLVLGGVEGGEDVDY